MNIFITGTSSGLGYELANQFLDHNNLVIGLSRRTPDFSKKSNYRHIESNLLILEDIKDNLIESLNQIKEFDIVILNAATIGSLKDLKDTNINEFRNVMDINLMANKIIMDTLFALGIKIKQIIAISTGASINAHKGLGAYSISKAALNKLIEFYSLEYIDTHFTALAPGIIDTPMQNYLCYENNSQFEVSKTLKSAKDSGRMPNAYNTAKALIRYFPELLELSSGSYHSINITD